MGDEFTSAAAFGIDIGLTLNVHVCVLNPGHGLLVGAHIRTEAINLSTNETFLDELHSVLTGHTLDLILRVLAWVDLDTTLGTTEGHVSDSELESHEGSERFDLLQIDVGSVASTTLDGKLVCRVLSSVASDGLESAVVATERDVEPDDGLAGLDEVEVLLIDASHVGGFVVEKLDLLEETRLLISVHLWSELLLGGTECAAHG